MCCQGALVRSNYIWTIELSPNTPFCRISPPRSQSGGHSALTLVAGCIRSASTQAPEVRSKRSNRMRGGCFRQCDRRFAGSPGSSSGSPGPTKRTTIQDPCPSQVHPELPIASATRSSRRSMLDIAQVPFRCATSFSRSAMPLLKIAHALSAHPKD